MNNFNEATLFYLLDTALVIHLKCLYFQVLTYVICFVFLKCTVKEYTNFIDFLSVMNFLLYKRVDQVTSVGIIFFVLLSKFLVFSIVIHY